MSEVEEIDEAARRMLLGAKADVGDADRYRHFVGVSTPLMGTLLGMLLQNGAGQYADCGADCFHAPCMRSRRIYDIARAYLGRSS